jgi:hypothetical protein
MFRGWQTTAIGLDASRVAGNPNGEAFNLVIYAARTWSL